ncbi:MAG: hypothetical protein L0Z50_11210 [Verrucomicrobiales bacterium]|nr:hypothetical protein [Verrucomicrobiales bacterium]
MKRYAIIAAALLLGAGCQTRQHDTSSTTEPSRGTSYGTPGMGVQSEKRSSSQSDRSLTVPDATPYRDAVQEPKSQTTPDTEIIPDPTTPDVKNENVPPSDPDRPDSTKNVPPVQPDQNRTDAQPQIDLNTEKPIQQEDPEAPPKPVEPVTPDQPVP